MSLFQTSVLKKYLKQQDSDAVAKAYRKFTKYFHDSNIQKNIRSSKEEEYQGIFLTELFVKVLGYAMKPNEPYNLVAEYKNEKNSKKADGAILKDGQALSVIELKGTNTKDLEKVRQQAFDYKANQTGCVYVITSNFEKLRFYINNAVDFEEFDLFDLKPERFELLYLCLIKENVLNNLPLKIKEESVQEEEKITKDFYKHYSLFKRELFRDLVKLNMRNEVFRSELNNTDADRGTKNIKRSLFKKSQKLIDRFLFIFFAEDRGLLPPNSTVKILEDWNDLKDRDAYFPLYERFKLYFKYLDQGRAGTEKKAEIFAYNGGLFKPDAVLNSLLISDELLYKHAENLSGYDFESQVDVNILGHIFENSLNEIESVNAEIEGADFDKQKSKRKKDGVFYTPKYITKYMVDNTVGKLCAEKKTEIGIEPEIEFARKADGKLSKKAKDYYALLEQYRQWLLQITIVDPACGSGAFLNQALNFLIEEHSFITEQMRYITGDASVMFVNIEKTILENNIYGVDINEESVEIAKLSLWLRTAQPRRKLNVLSNNIKCGNSLIESKAIAGDKAFKWENEFPEIFTNGGFDVVIGNPPYVFGGNEGISTEEKKFYKENYATGGGKVNLFTLFIELSYKILNGKSEFSFIIPNTFLRVTSYDESRRFFINNYNFRQLGDLGNDIFQGAVTSAIILVASKTKKAQQADISIFKDFTGRYNTIELKDIVDSNYIIPTNLTKDKVKILRKMRSHSKFLGDECKEMIFGVVITKNKDELVSKTPQEGYKPFLEGRDIGRYLIKPIHQYLNYNPKLLHRARSIEIFESKEKLLVQRITGGNKPLKVAYDDNGYYNKESLNNVILKDTSEFTAKFTLCLLNSSLINWYYNNQFTNGSTLTVNISKEYLSKIPVIVASNQDKFIEKADQIIQSASNLNGCTDKFVRYLESKFNGIVSSSKLDSFYEHSFSDFIKELNKAIKKAGGEKLSKLDEIGWMEVFESKKAEAQTLKAEIDKIDHEIDTMVYELYGLTEEEIKIVEESTC